MFFKYLPFVIPTIFCFGWAIALVQANRVKDDISNFLHSAIMTIFSIGFVTILIRAALLVFKIDAQAVEVFGYFCLSFSSIAMTTYYVIKKDWTGIAYFGIYGSWCMYSFLKILIEL